MRVGGLRIVDRAIKQLARLRDARVIVATDGSVRLPSGWGGLATWSCCTLSTATPRRPWRPWPAGLQGADRGRGDTVVAADQPARPGHARRRQGHAAGGRGRDLQGPLARRPRLVAPLINKRISFPITRYLLVHLPFTPNLITLIAGFIGLYGALLIATGTYENVLYGFLSRRRSRSWTVATGELARGAPAADGDRRVAWTPSSTTWLNLALVLAVGIGALHAGRAARRGREEHQPPRWGTLVDLKTSLAAAGMLLFLQHRSYRELVDRARAARSSRSAGGSPTGRA